MIYEQKFILALIQTLLIEVPVLVFFVHYFYNKNKSDTIKIELYKTILIGILATSLTLPYLWFVLPVFISDRFLFVLFGEVFIVIIEMVIYNQFFHTLNLKRAFIISLTANTLSVLGGIILG